MKFFILAKMVGIVLLFGAWEAIAYDDFGIVMDVKGQVSVERNDKSAPAEVGNNLHIKDTLIVNKGASMTAVSYDDCCEWVVRGPARVKIDSDETFEIQSAKCDWLKKVRELPVCYSHEEFNKGELSVIGGVILRKSDVDPAALLRKEFKMGKASNAALITLIMHDLLNGQIEKARPYYNALKKRNPGTVFLQGLEKKFGNP